RRPSRDLGREGGPTWGVLQATSGALQLGDGALVLEANDVDVAEQEWPLVGRVEAAAHVLEDDRARHLAPRDGVAEDGEEPCAGLVGFHRPPVLSGPGSRCLTARCDPPRRPSRRAA